MEDTACGRAWALPFLYWPNLGMKPPVRSMFIFHLEKWTVLWLHDQSLLCWLWASPGRLGGLVCIGEGRIENEGGKEIESGISSCKALLAMHWVSALSLSWWGFLWWTDGFPGQRAQVMQWLSCLRNRDGAISISMCLCCGLQPFIHTAPICLVPGERLCATGNLMALILEKFLADLMLWETKFKTPGWPNRCLIFQN